MSSNAQNFILWSGCQNAWYWDNCSSRLSRFITDCTKTVQILNLSKSVPWNPRRASNMSFAIVNQWQVKHPPPLTTISVTPCGHYLDKMVLTELAAGPEPVGAPWTHPQWQSQWSLAAAGEEGLRRASETIRTTRDMYDITWTSRGKRPRWKRWCTVWNTKPRQHTSKRSSNHWNTNQVPKCPDLTSYI